MACLTAGVNSELIGFKGIEEIRWVQDSSPA